MTISPTDFCSPAEIIVAGHRGYKAKYTENTIYGFTKCYESGATDFETDVYLTLDNEVVISHDVNTKRIFVEPDGTPADRNILESKYDDLKELRTHNGERLLRFSDVLEWYVDYVVSNNAENHKIMLDIKRLNPPKILRYMIKSMLEVNSDLGWWLPRLQFGVWDLNMVKYFNQHQYFQDVFRSAQDQFDIYHVAVNWRDSLAYFAYNEYLHSQPEGRKQFLVTGVSLLYLLTWSTEFVLKFMPLLRSSNMKLYSWTVNTVEQLRYVSALQRTYRLPEMGIISDDPAKMVDQLAGESTPTLSLESSRTSDWEVYEKLLGRTAVKPSFMQKVLSFLYESYLRMLGAKLVTSDELEFAEPVDENLRRKPKFNKVAMWIFQKCQKYGIF